MAELLWLNSNKHIFYSHEKLGVRTLPSALPNFDYNVPVVSTPARYTGAISMPLHGRRVDFGVAVGTGSWGSIVYDDAWPIAVGGDFRYGAKTTGGVNAINLLQVSQLGSGGSSNGRVHVWLLPDTEDIVVWLQRDASRWPPSDDTFGPFACPSDFNHWLEVEFYPHISSGTLRVLLNDQELVNVSGQTNGGTTNHAVSFRTGWPCQPITAGDIMDGEIGVSFGTPEDYPDGFWFGESYITRGAGAPLFGSELQIGFVRPVAVGTHSDSTPTGVADQLEAVEDPVPDNATGYNILTAVNETDTFLFEEVEQVNADDVYGLQMVIRARAIGGTVEVVPYFVIGGVGYSGELGAAQPLPYITVSTTVPFSDPSGFGTYTMPSMNNPATALPFTTDDLNDPTFEMGYRVRTVASGAELHVTQFGYEVIALSLPASTVMHMKTLD